MNREIIACLAAITTSSILVLIVRRFPSQWAGVAALLFLSGLASYGLLALATWFDTITQPKGE
jgi:hypothetical protein